MHSRVDEVTTSTREFLVLLATIKLALAFYHGKVDKFSAGFSFLNQLFQLALSVRCNPLASKNVGDSHTDSDTQNNERSAYAVGHGVG